MCIPYLGQKVTTWVSRDHGDHLGQTQVITSYYLVQSYHLGRNNTIQKQETFFLVHPLNFEKVSNWIERKTWSEFGECTSK